MCVLGGSGFVGRHLIGKLVKLGYFVKVPSRDRERHRELLVLPTVSVNTTDIYNTDELNEQLSGVDIVINLVGILNQGGRNNSFKETHVELTRNIVSACQKNGITRLLHMSALNADAGKGVSEYLRTKGEAEDVAHQAEGINVTSFRPSVIFGMDDNFFNRFATLLKIIPSVFPLACPNSKFAPVYVGDVVECFAQAIDNKETFNQRYELCGPDVYSLKQLVQYTAKQIGVKKPVWGLGNGLSSIQATMMGFLPGKPFSRDNYKSLQVDSICDDEFPAVFKVEPSSVETVMSKYLAKKNLRGRFYGLRTHAKRN